MTKGFGFGYGQSMLARKRLLAALPSIVSTGFLCAGDSGTYGAGNNGAGQVSSPYPAQMATITGLTAYNGGVTGARLSELIDWYDDVGGWRDSVVPPLNTIALFAGANDITWGGATAMSLAAMLETFANLVVSEGKKLILGSLSPNSYNDDTPAFLAVRLGFNDWLRNNWQRFAHGFADLGLAPLLQNLGDTTIRQADRAHLTSAGNSVIAQLMARAAGIAARNLFGSTNMNGAGWALGSGVSKATSGSDLRITTPGGSGGYITADGARPSFGTTPLIANFSADVKAAAGHEGKTCRLLYSSFDAGFTLVETKLGNPYVLTSVPQRLEMEVRTNATVYVGIMLDTAGIFIPSNPMINLGPLSEPFVAVP